MNKLYAAAALAGATAVSVFGLAVPSGAVASDSASASGSSASAAAPAQVSGAHASAVTPQTISDCPATYFCFWQDANYTGTPGKLSGNNANWTAFSHPGCQTGTWNDCASSGYNHGTSGLGVEVWQNANYGGLSACLPKGWTAANFAGLVWPGSSTSFNDSISSNSWTSIC